MIYQSGRKFFKSSNWQFHLAIAGGFGLLLAAFSLLLSPQMIIIVLAIAGVVVAAVKRPEIALLGILAATSSIIFEERLPLIPIGIGSLHIPDLILLALFGLILVRWLVEPDFEIIHTPLDLPLLAFYGVALLSTFIAVFQSSVEIEMARRAIRTVTYYLTFFIITNLVRENRQLRLLLRGLFFLATIVAAAMVAQFMLGESVAILPGRVEILSTWGENYIGITRVLPPGQSLIQVSFIAMTAVLVLDKFKPIKMLGFLQWALLGLAILLTFNRNFWAGVFLALFILAFLVKGQDRKRLIVWGLVITLIGVSLLLAAFNTPESQLAKLLQASFERLETFVNTKTIQESSLQFRYIENEYALRQINPPSLIGLGLGARYRPLDPRLDYEEWDARRYIHNGYLWILLKTGLLGFIGLMWLSIVFLNRGFRYWRLIPNSQMRGIVLGFNLTYIGVMASAVVNPIFMQWYWTPVIGILMGTNEVILRKVIREEGLMV